MNPSEMPSATHSLLSGQWSMALLKAGNLNFQAFNLTKILGSLPVESPVVHILRTHPIVVVLFWFGFCFFVCFFLFFFWAVLTAIIKKILNLFLA